MSDYEFMLKIETAAAPLTARENDIAANIVRLYGELSTAGRTALADIFRVLAERSRTI